MTTKVEPTIEGWEKYYKMANGKLDEYIGFAFGKCMDMGSEIGGLMSVKRLPMFTEAIKYFLSHSVQEAKAEERERIFNGELLNLANKVEEAIKVVTGHNQIFAEQNRKDLALMIKVLLAYIKGASLKQEEENHE